MPSSDTEAIPRILGNTSNSQFLWIKLSILERIWYLHISILNTCFYTQIQGGPRKNRPF